MKKYFIEFKWAMIFIAMMLSWMFLEMILGFHGKNIDQHVFVTNFVAIPAIAIYVFALLDKKKNYFGGVMTYKQSFLSGLVMTLIITLFSPLTQYITSAWISPNYFANAIEFAVSTGKMTQQAAEEFFNMKSYITQTIIGTPIMGIVTTAIVSIFVSRAKKEKI